MAYSVAKLWVKGSGKDFPSGTQNTSYIERFNLTLRQRISYLHRKTLGYCKNKTNLNRLTQLKVEHKFNPISLPGLPEFLIKKICRAKVEKNVTGKTEVNEPNNRLI